MSPEPRTGGEEARAADFAPTSPEAWLVIRNGDVPEIWKHRGEQVLMVPLLPDEADSLLGGRLTTPAIAPLDEPLAHLVAKGLSIEQIATQLSMSSRSVQRRIARMREMFRVGSKEELAVQLARRGF